MSAGGQYPGNLATSHRAAILAAVLLMLAGGGLEAHESWPVYVEVRQIAAHRYQLLWKASYSIPSADIPAVSLPAACSAVGALAEFRGADGLIRRIAYQCSNDLVGEQIRINRSLNSFSMPSVVVYVAASGERQTAVLDPQAGSWTIPPAQTKSKVAQRYLLLGIEHLLSGVDHILFLACLFWIAGSVPRLLVTMTGFTLAHSITLACSALRLIHPPVAPIEAAIALSVLFLASEVARGVRSSLIWRYPVAISSCFGLLHGFGFAAALGGTGLPQKEIVTGLLCFNLGIEVGQLLIALAVLGMVYLVRRVSAAAANHVSIALPRFAAYSIGVTAAFWTIQRILIL